MRRFLAVMLLLAASRPASARPDDALEAQLRAIAAGYQGKVALYAADLRSGKTVAIDADTPVPTASTIKLTILFEALKQIQEGRVRFDDKLTLTPENQVIGSGVLNQFDTPLSLTFKDALTMMIVVSDNSGTNLAIDHLGLKNIDDRIRWMGLRETWLYKKVFKPPVGPQPADQKKFGLGKTTAREMAEVMRRFATCDLNAPGSTAKPTQKDRALCAAALKMLMHQTEREGIPRYLGNLTVANKGGAIDASRSDVGIVYARNGPIVISVYTYDNADQSWTVDNAGRVLIGELAKAIVDRWD
ncbi:MAG TPA: serine hydrolase [Candidatus Baltobacteraceae bacterium]|nr:serine hydrolase [Candidatus Baltobacteraceae bacterium]